MKKLTKELVQKNNAPTKILQFGEGNFMRGFVDWQIQQLNNQELYRGNVTIVQPLPMGLGEMLNNQDNLYTVILQGLLDGEIIDSSEVITVVDDVINPYQQWNHFLSLAENEDLEFIFSNTTEAGIQYLESDQLQDMPPESFPGKLTAFLYRRFAAGKVGLTIIPCELIDRNGEKLKEIILRYAHQWDLGAEFITWLDQENIFCCSLVDRIVPGYPRESASVFNERHGYEDQLMVKAEPFMLWVIEGPETVKEKLPLVEAGLNVVFTEDMTPYRERKVHLLNGPHTAMVPIARLAGLETVEDVMKDPLFSGYIDQLFATELIPMLALPESELIVYAEQIKERFLNPFANHKLEAISLNSISKFTTRLLPVFRRYADEKNQLPPLMSISLAALLLMYRNDQVTVHDDPVIVERFKSAWEQPTTAVATLLQDETLWGTDLSKINSLTATIESLIEKIEAADIRQVVSEMEGTMMNA